MVTTNLSLRIGYHRGRCEVVEGDIESRLPLLSAFCFDQWRLSKGNIESRLPLLSAFCSDQWQVVFFLVSLSMFTCSQPTPHGQQTYSQALAIPAIATRKKCCCCEKLSSLTQVSWNYLPLVSASLESIYVSLRHVESQLWERL